MNFKRISTQLMYSTMIIKCKKSDGFYYTGTGFFFQMVLPNKNSIIGIVTNKHVVEDAVEITAIVQEAKVDGIGNKTPKNHGTIVRLEVGSKGWIPHPDKEVDLCLAPVDVNLEAVKNSFFITIPEELIKSDDDLASIQAVEEVLMVGYPLGRYDTAHHLPIFRKGITASHPSIDFNNKPEGLCDISVFPGSSGSPVLIVNEGWFIDGDKLITGSRTILLGVLSQYYAMDVEEEQDPKDVPIKLESIRGSQYPANLAVYVKAKELLVLKNEILRLHPELRV